jgi:hypothetical protein
MGVARPRASKKALKKGRDFIKSIPRLRSAIRVTVLEEWSGVAVFVWTEAIHCPKEQEDVFFLSPV